MITLPYNITCGYYDCSEFGDLSISPKRKTTKFEFEFYLEDLDAQKVVFGQLGNAATGVEVGGGRLRNSADNSKN